MWRPEGMVNLSTCGSTLEHLTAVFLSHATLMEDKGRKDLSTQ